MGLALQTNYLINSSSTYSGGLHITYYCQFRMLCTSCTPAVFLQPAWVQGETAHFNHRSFIKLGFQPILYTVYGFNLLLGLQYSFSHVQFLHFAPLRSISWLVVACWKMRIVLCLAQTLEWDIGTPAGWIAPESSCPNQSFWVYEEQISSAASMDCHSTTPDLLEIHNIRPEVKTSTIRSKELRCSSADCSDQMPHLYSQVNPQ